MRCSRRPGQGTHESISRTITAKAKEYQVRQVIAAIRKMEEPDGD